MAKSKEEALQQYKDRLERYKEKLKQAEATGQTFTPTRDVRPLTFSEMKQFRNAVNPTNRKKSLRLTYDLIKLYYEKEVLTRDEIESTLKTVDKVVTKRQKKLLNFGLIFRIGKYYVATPRLKHFVDNGLNEVFRECL